MAKDLQVRSINRIIAISMGTTKTELFPEHYNRLAAWAKALGHPARIAILESLMKKGSCVCGELVEDLPLSQATVSQHLKALKEVGIIRGDVEGVYRCYCIDQKQCAEMMQGVAKLFSQLKNCC